MKSPITFFLFFSVFFWSIQINAQITVDQNTEQISPISKGNWMIEGNLQISNVDNDFLTANRQIDLAPTVGYFFADRLLFGASISLEHTKITTLSDDEFKGRTFQVAPFLRYYLTDKKIKPYLQLTGVFQSIKNEATGNQPPLTFSNNALFGQIGFDFFLSKNAALNVNLSGRVAGDPLEEDFSGGDLGALLNGRVLVNAGINFYLSQKTIMTEPTPLIDRYFQKGNRILGVIGNINFDPFVLLGSVYSKKFKTTKTRRNLLMEGFLGKDFLGENFAFVGLFRPEIEHFFQLGQQSFFAPSAGVGLAMSSAGSDTEVRVNVQLYPKFVVFTQKGLLDAGLQINSPFTNFSDNTEDRWLGSFILGGEYFIQDNLSLRGEFYFSIFGDGQYGFSPIFDALSDRVFRIGVNYFMEG